MRISRTIQKVKDKYQHGQGDYAHLFAPYEGDEMVSLDCETTSLDISEARILSIGAVKIRGKKVVNSERLELTLNAPASLNGDSIKIHKLRAVDLQDGIDAQEAMEKLLAFIGNLPLLGYNIDYDARVLDKYLRASHGFSLPNRLIELCRLYERSVHRVSVDAGVDMRFDTLSERLNIPIIGRHTAIGDALTVALMYVRLQYGERPSTH